MFNLRSLVLIFETSKLPLPCSGVGAVLLVRAAKAGWSAALEAVRKKVVADKIFVGTRGLADDAAVVQHLQESGVKIPMGIAIQITSATRTMRMTE